MGNPPENGYWFLDRVEPLFVLIFVQLVFSFSQSFPLFFFKKKHLLVFSTLLQLRWHISFFNKGRISSQKLQHFFYIETSSEINRPNFSPIKLRLGCRFMRIGRLFNWPYSLIEGIFSFSCLDRILRHLEILCRYGRYTPLEVAGTGRVSWIHPKYVTVGLNWLSCSAYAPAPQPMARYDQSK